MPSCWALHHAIPGDLSDSNLAVPADYAPAPICAGPEETPRDVCSHALLAWLPRHDTDAGTTTQAQPVADPVIQLSVVTPEAGTRVWLNPESPATASRLVAAGKDYAACAAGRLVRRRCPFALTDPDQPVSWPMRAGEHRFQIGLPLRPERSRLVRLLVQ